jgi:2-oxoisovalerate dehydrogenase E1 component alpha subunit
MIPVVKSIPRGIKLSLLYHHAHQSRTFHCYAAVNMAQQHPRYPGAKNAPFTTELFFQNATTREGTPHPIYHIIDVDGNVVNKKDFEQVQETLNNDKILHMYKTMIQLETMDDILYNAQRQGRVSFYMTNFGEEAIQVGSAAALEPTDEIYAQYRESGVLMYRGFTLEEFMNQCFSTSKDYGKGRQMPVHYGSKRLRFQTISSPLGTQIPQASGAGYVLKLEKRPDVCVCYFGEGAASEGDFHAALNFASTLKSQTLFICRNNGYAISTPTSEQYNGDGIVARGFSYGMHSIRVDGNDLFASYLVTLKAREMSVKESIPVLIEAMTYRGGHHSTSDDSTRYRSSEELNHWKNVRNPILRIRKYLDRNKLWTDEQEKQVRDQTRRQVLALLTEVSKAPKVPFSELVNDVYDVVPKHLEEQKLFTEAIVNKYPEFYANDH